MRTRRQSGPASARYGLFALVLSLCGLGAASLGAKEEAQSEGPGSDLVVEIVKRFPSELQPGQALQCGLLLRNVSRTQSHAVVAPGDGSDEGWREPHIWFEIERRHPDGKWKKVPQQKRTRCKLHDSDWRKDVRILAPGAALDVRPWSLGPDAYDLQRGGSYGIRAHYAWRRQPAPGVDGDLGGMKAVPAFELVSKRLVFRVVRPLDVRVEVLAPVPAKGISIGAVLNVHGVNATEKPLRWAPMEWLPEVVLEGASLRKNKIVMPADHDLPQVLEPGRSWVAFAGWSARHDLLPDPEASEVWVTLTLRSLTPGGPRIRAERVRLRVAR